MSAGVDESVNVDSDQVQDRNPLLRRPSFWLAAIAIAFAITQFGLIDIDRYLAWDEAVYLSEVSPAAESIDMYAHRARGITLIVAPIALVTDSVFWVRTYLVVVGSVGLFGAFYTWVRTISWAAPIAAALFGSSWVVMGYASEIIPNYYSALAAVTAIGLAIASMRSPGIRGEVGVGLAVFVATLIRPLDGVVLVIAISLGLLLFRQPMNGALVRGGALGAVAGIIPWVVEAWFRFGGPIRRLELTSEIVGGGLTSNLDVYLEMMGAPLGAGQHAATPLQSGIWLVILLGFSAVALISTKGDDRRTGTLSLLTSFLLAAPYLFYTEAAAPRFMIPTLAFLAISSAMGAQALFRARRLRWLALAVVTFLLGLVSLVNLRIADQWSEAQTELRSSSPVLARQLAELASGPPCFFLSTFGHPQISFASGCSGARLGSDPDENLALLYEKRAEGNAIYVLAARDTPEELLDSTWECVELNAPRNSRWHLCNVSASPSAAAVTRRT